MTDIIQNELISEEQQLDLLVNQDNNLQYDSKLPELLESISFEDNIFQDEDTQDNINNEHVDSLDYQNNIPMLNNNDNDLLQINEFHQNPSIFIISNPEQEAAETMTSINTETSNKVFSHSQKIWEMDKNAPDCRRCHRSFTFLVRRHHCRRCGQIICDKCSLNRVKLPVEELIEDPMISPSQYPYLASYLQRVCDSCYHMPIERKSHHQHHLSVQQYESQMKRSGSSQSLMFDCPVCGLSFFGMQKSKQEVHLQNCLNAGQAPICRPRYIVYQLSTDSKQIGDECPICFDEFNRGDTISRMVCLCSYHQHCLSSWLQKGKGCPVHYDYLHI